MVGPGLKVSGAGCGGVSVLTLWIAAPSLGISKGSFHLTVADIAPAVRLIIRLN